MREQPEMQKSIGQKMATKLRTVRGRLPIYGNANACRIERLFWPAAAMGEPLPQRAKTSIRAREHMRAG
jgi:hypothetical protein